MKLAFNATIVTQVLPEGGVIVDIRVGNKGVVVGSANGFTDIDVYDDLNRKPSFTKTIGQ